MRPLPRPPPPGPSRGSLLAVDVGLRTGLALYGRDRRLRWYRSQHWPDRARMRRAVHGLLRAIDDLEWVAVEGGGPLAEIWAPGAPLRTVVEGGARAFLYGPGMLHSKLTVVDDSVAFLGSANADMRSLYLNFEIGVLAYSRPEVAAVTRVLQHYMAAGQGIDPAAGRHPLRWVLEDTARLLSPLL